MQDQITENPYLLLDINYPFEDIAIILGRDFIIGTLSNVKPIGERRYVSSKLHVPSETAEGSICNSYPRTQNNYYVIDNPN